MTDNAQRYAEAFFPTMNGKLCAGTVPIETLLAENQGNPLYIYSQDCIRHVTTDLTRKLPHQIKLLYSVKANPWEPVINTLGPLIDGFDTASKGELESVLSCKKQADSLLIMTGPGKSDHDLDAAIQNNVIINLESRFEFDRLTEMAIKANKPVRVMLRLNPDLQLRTSGMKMSGGAKPFGVDMEKADGLIRDIADSNLDFQGVHVFCGSQCLDENAITTAHTHMFAQLSQLQRDTNTQFKIINLGGGFGIPYFEQDRPLDVAIIGNALGKLISQHQHEFNKVTFVLEMGRYLVGQAGVYACKVIDIKESRGSKFVITNGGMHHHLAASGNLGQVIRKNYPVFNASRMETEPETVTVVGPLCTPLDILANDIQLALPQIGDTIAIMQSGAYGFTASPQQFLSHAPCGQRLV